jgi:hypothetical protein
MKRNKNLFCLKVHVTGNKIVAYANGGLLLFFKRISVPIFALPFTPQRAFHSIF